MIPISRLIQKKRRWAAHVVHDDVNIPIIIDIPESSAAPRLQRPIVQTSGISNLFKGAVAFISKELQRLAIFQLPGSVSTSCETLPFAIKISGQPLLSKSTKPVPHRTGE